jgi:L-alanine-DL-glutamate epimerase-like enolase superfamily enzyme
MGPSPMKITAIRTHWFNLPLPEPIGTAIHRVEAISGMAVFVDTDAGVTGEGLLWCMGVRRLPVLEAMVHSLAPVVVGRDPAGISGIWGEMWRDINFFGHKGVTLFGIAAIDMALWDIAGKSRDEPVHRLLGSARDRIRAYHSGGLWVSMSTDELVAQAKAFVADGFRAMKMRFGKPSVTEDIERLAAVRAAIGPDIELMADANQGFSVSRAIRQGRALEGYDLVWFEEPVQAYDLEGSARVAAEIDTPIASGETEYARYGFRDMLERKSADVLMPDLERVGGISEYIRVANMAAAYDVPVSPHLYSEHAAQLCAAIPNTNYAEYMPWFAPLFRERLDFVDGDLMVPARPGLGFNFDPAALEQFKVDRQEIG